MTKPPNSPEPPGTIATASIDEVLSFDMEQALQRQLPFALIVGLFGLVMLFVVGDGQAQGMFGSLYVMAAGFCIYAAYLIWRRFNPGEPVLVLSPEGIRYRAVGKHAFTIPWDEVQNVDSADIQVKRMLFGSMERGVPVVMVTEDFYREHIHIDSRRQRGPGWKYAFIPKDGGLVQVAIFYKLLSQSGIELRAAIERRWRAFSSNPNAKLTRMLTRHD